MTRQADTLEKVSKIYDLIKEANDIANELNDFGVLCRLGGPSARDPLNQFAEIQITLSTDFETLNR